MATSLLDWIMHLLQNPEAREQFQADPQGTMASAGMGSVCGQDVRDARAFLLDNPNVHQVNEGHTAAVRSESGHDHVRHIVDNYTFAPSHKPGHRVEHFTPMSHNTYLRADHLHTDGNPDTHPVHRAAHVAPARVNEHHDRFDRFDRNEDSHDHYYHGDDSHDRQQHSVHEFGVGPTTHGGTAGDQHNSEVAHDQLEMGGRGNLLGDANDFSDRHEVNQTRTETADSHRHDQTVSGNGAAGHDIHANHTNTVDHTDTTVNGNGASGRDLHSDHTTVSGNGSAGHDVHVDKNGPVMGQGMANGDIDHTGSLAGLDHTVSVGDVNLLSGLVNTGDVLDGSLDHSLNHSPILSGDTIPVLSPSVLSNDPILSGILDHSSTLSGILDHSPVLSGDLNNSLNHVLNHDLNGDLNHSLNHLGQGSLDDLLHNTDIHDIHDIHVLA